MKFGIDKKELTPTLVGTNAFTIYQLCFYHVTTSNYDIDAIKNNTYFGG